MTKRNKPTSEEELQDAINRIKKNPEAKRGARNSDDWQDFLSDVLNINPSSDKAQDFWEDVRRGVKGQRPQHPKYSETDLSQAGVLKGSRGYYVSEKTKQTSYRGANGRWVKVRHYDQNGKEIY